MTAAPLVSVVSVYYNRAANVDEAVASLLAQTYPNLEIIIADDGSTDDTLARLKAFDDPRLTILEGPNSGFTNAVNRAVRASKGEYVAIHGSGDISHPERIAEQAALLDARPEVGVVGCWVRSDSAFSGKALLHQPTIEGDGFAQLLKSNPFTHGEVMFRRAAFDQVGGYRPFFTFAQDRDLWLRMSRITGLGVVPKVLYTRAQPANAVSTSPAKVITQAYLSDFAVQCARGRAADAPDLLDRYGAAAPFYRHRSPALAHRLAMAGTRWLQAGRTADAQTMLDNAAREHPSMRLRLLRGLTPLARFKPAIPLLKLLAYAPGAR